MSDLGKAAQARRFYHHVLNGGKLTPENVSIMVQTIEELEAECRAHAGNARENYNRLMAAEAKLVDPATIRTEALRVALIQIDALDPEGFTESCSDFAIRGLVNRMGKIARDALALIDKEQDHG